MTQFKSRSEALETISKISLMRFEDKHVSALAWALAYTFDLNTNEVLESKNGVVFKPEETTTIENCCHLLFEHTTIDKDQVADVKEATKDFYSWRLANSNGSLLQGFFLHNEPCCCGAVLKMNDYIDVRFTNGLSTLRANDDAFCNAMLELVKSEYRSNKTNSMEEN